MNAPAPQFLPITSQCEGCDRITDGASGSVCTTFINPEHKWSLGSCNLASHVKVKVERKVAVNPLKASKKAAAGG